MEVSVWHNILWSRYKGQIFSTLNNLQSAIKFQFFQVAETDAERLSLAPLDLSYHTYPYTLLFKGAYSNIRLASLLLQIGRLTLSSRSDAHILAGYHRVEYWLQMLILRARNKKVFVFCDSTANDQQQSKVKDFLKRLFFRQCDGVLCYGERSRDYVRSFGVPLSRIVIGCQAASRSHDYDASQIFGRRMQNIKKLEKPRFLFVGQLTTRKNVDILLRAFAEVLKTLPLSSLFVVGSGPELNNLLNFAKKLGVEGSVHFVGPLFDQALVEQYMRASCLILPSRSEPWGLVVNEAMSHGCPAIVSDRCGCVPELITPGETGWVVKNGDPVDLALKMQQAVGVESSIKVALRCIDRAAFYSPERAAKNILQACENVLCSQPSLRAESQSPPPIGLW
jgi:glycosyltransferase involved in cell wall biosynthesis